MILQKMMAMKALEDMPHSSQRTRLSRDVGENSA